MKSLVLLTTAGLLLSWGSISQSQSKKLAPRTNWRDVYRALDANQDGTVALEELADLKAAAELVLKLCNKDGDTGLSAVELIEVREIASKADLDTNGYVSRQELETWLANWRDQLAIVPRKPVAPVKPAPPANRIVVLASLLDLQQDGLSSRDLSNNTKSTSRVLKRLDLDKDSALSPFEIRYVAEKKDLEKADVDGKDGVSRRELAIWLQAWRDRLRQEERN